MPNIVLLFPGQGSQQPGMGKDLHDSFAQARSVFEDAEECLRIPLRRICFESNADELRDTRNAQLALLVHAAAVWSVLLQRIGSTYVAAAGHSVGEYAAFHCAGVLSLDTALRLVFARASAMWDSGAEQPGAMAALLGTSAELAVELCREASTEGQVVVPANFNAPEQVVVSGNVEAVERAMQLASARGAKKVVRLNVSGAFHSPLMHGAAGTLRAALEAASFADARIPVYSNVTAEACTTGAEARSLLARQLTAPVRWVELMRGIERDFPDSLCLELGPGNVLAGLVKRCAPSLRTKPCGTVRDLEALEVTA